MADATRRIARCGDQVGKLCCVDACRCAPDNYSGDHRAARVTDRDSGGGESLIPLADRYGITATAHKCQLFKKCAWVGDSARRVLHQTAAGNSEHGALWERREQHLAGGDRMHCNWSASDVWHRCQVWSINLADGNRCANAVKDFKADRLV